MMTRMVSPNPPSDFVPDVTLIGFPSSLLSASRASPYAAAICAPHANSRSLRVEELGASDPILTFASPLSAQFANVRIIGSLQNVGFQWSLRFDIRFPNSRLGA